jgi:uncharacterized alpha-E superfamily protein
MLDCVRRESVAVVNSIGSVLAQTPALMPYLDAAHEFFHGGSLPLPASETYWCGDAEHLAYVLEHADRLIFRNAMSVSSQPAKTTAGMTDEQRQAFLAELKEQPEDYVAHQPLPYSRTPVWSAGQIRSPKVALRTFQLLTEGDVQVLPGGLARVGQDELELSRSPVIGQMTLDCWVTSDTPIEEHQSLLPDSDAPIRLRRSGDELPSRVAEHLYWLGRYAERAEGIARALRTTLSRIAGEEDWGSRPEIRRLVYALASMGQIEASFAVDSFAANMPQVEQTLPDSILDRDQPRGLIRTMDSVMHNATAVRDRLSVDAYRIVGRAYQELKAPVSAVSASAPSRVSIDQAIERVGTLVVDLLALAGVFSESFVRTHAWQFLELGRRIERADQLCDLLATTLCPATKDGKAICLAVLETTDSSMTYRSRYLNLVRLAAVIDLLVTDETNPRSLRFQLDRITELMEQLPSVEGPVGLDAIQRIVLDMQYHVTTADPTGLAQPAEDGKLQTLDALLRRVSESLPRLSEGINARYLIHTEAQQFLTGTGR